MISLFTSKNPNKWIGLVLASLALAIVVIDGTVLNVSQRNIIDSIGLSHNQSSTLEGFKGLQWAITLYSLIVAALTIWGGRIADKYGRKNIFLLGAAIFGLGSLITALSYYWGVDRAFGDVHIYGMHILILGWSVIEGIGAAMMLPATISLIIANFQGKERGQAFGIWGATAGFAAAIGPLLGGYFTTYFNWSWAFLINLVVVAILIAFSGNIVDTSVRNKNLKIDYTSVLLSGLGITSITYGLIQASDFGWWNAKAAWESPWGANYNLGLSITPYAITLGLVLIGLFVYRQIQLKKDSRAALIDLDLFKSRQYSIGLVSLVFFSIAFASLLFALPFYFQVVLGLDAFHSGLAFLPFSIASLISAPLGGFMSTKIAPKLLVLVGIGFISVGLLWVGLQLNLNWNALSFIGPFTLMGIGGGLAQAQLGGLTLAQIGPRQSGEASGVQSAVRQLGQTISTALIGSVFVSILVTSVVTNINNLNNLPEAEKQGVISTFSTTKPLYSLSPDVQKKAIEARETLMNPDTASKLDNKQKAILTTQGNFFISPNVAEKLRLSIVESSKAALLTGALSGFISLVVAGFFSSRPVHHEEDAPSAGR